MTCPAQQQPRQQNRSRERRLVAFQDASLSPFSIRAGVAPPVDARGFSCSCSNRGLGSFLSCSCRPQPTGMGIVLAVTSGFCEMSICALRDDHDSIYLFVSFLLFPSPPLIRSSLSLSLFFLLMPFFFCSTLFDSHHNSQILLYLKS